MEKLNKTQKLVLLAAGMVAARGDREFHDVDYFRDIILKCFDEKIPKRQIKETLYELMSPVTHDYSFGITKNYYSPYVIGEAWEKEPERDTMGRELPQDEFRIYAIASSYWPEIVSYYGEKNEDICLSLKEKAVIMGIFGKINGYLGKMTREELLNWSSDTSYTGKMTSKELVNCVNAVAPQEMALMEIENILNKLRDTRIGIGGTGLTEYGKKYSLELNQYYFPDEGGELKREVFMENDYARSILKSHRNRNGEWEFILNPLVIAALGHQNDFMLDIFRG